MERLDCHVQNYDWGKKGTKSDVARIYAAGHNAVIDENKCYAEVCQNFTIIRTIFWISFLNIFCCTFFSLFAKFFI